MARFLVEDKSKTARKKANETILPVFTPLSRLSPSLHPFIPASATPSLSFYTFLLLLLLLLLLLRCLPIPCFLHLCCELATTVSPFLFIVSVRQRFFHDSYVSRYRKIAKNHGMVNENRTWIIIPFFFVIKCWIKKLIENRLIWSSLYFIRLIVNATFYLSNLLLLFFSCFRNISQTIFYDINNFTVYSYSKVSVRQKFISIHWIHSIYL